MSWAAHNPELYDEITIKALPEPWRTRVEEGEIELCDVPEDVRYKAAIEGERDHFADMVDTAKQQYKSDVITMGKEAADKRWGVKEK